MTCSEARSFLIQGMHGERCRLWGEDSEAGTAARCEGIVPFKPSRWMGRRLSPAESQAVYREMKRLESDGALKAIRGKRRITAVKLLHVATIGKVDW